MDVSRSFGVLIGDQLQTHARELAQRWLDRLGALLPLASNDIFPTTSLLDHVPDLIGEIGRFVAAENTDIVANTFIIEKARELGTLRHSQRSSVHQLLREYDLLRGILESFIIRQVEPLQPPPPCHDLVLCLRRVNAAVAILTQITVDTFIEQYADTVSAQSRRLEAFNRMVSHELRQPLGAAQTAMALLRTEGDGDPERRARRLDLVDRSLGHIAESLAGIGRMSGLESTADERPTVQRLSLVSAINESARRLRDTAEHRRVDIRVDPDLPEVTIDFSRLDLILTNLLSNGIKYSDPAKAERFVHASLAGLTDSECSIEIRDNGLGMTPEQARNAFTPFYRGHAARDAELRVEGTGMGLAIVRECVRAIGATIVLEAAQGEGSRFTIALPLRPRQ